MFEVECLPSNICMNVQKKEKGVVVVNLIIGYNLIIPNE